MEKQKKWREGIYLCTVATSLEAEILESKLRSESIPSLRKYQGAANFIEIAMGNNTTQPIEIYVPEDTLELAKEVIIPMPIDEDFDEF